MPSIKRHSTPVGCTKCRAVDLEGAFAEAWREDYLSQRWRKFRNKDHPRRQIPHRNILLPSISSILTETQCGLCFFIASALEMLPKDVQANVRGASSCHARLRVQQDDNGRPRIWSRFHDENYVKLDHDAQLISDRSRELRGLGSADSFLIPKPSFTVTIEVPVMGSDSLDLRRDIDGTAYITLGRIIPVKKRGLLTDKSRYPSYSGYVIGKDSAAERIQRWETWLKSCCISHEICSHVQYPTDKLRNMSGFSLVDAITDEVVPASPEMEYAALSYVWGQSVARTSKEDKNSNIHSEGSRYPLTIRDALLFTVSLGLRYLWVDAFCIPPEPSQRAEQIRKMDVIYECATVVIVAASSDHSDSGLHGVSLDQKAQLCSHFGDFELVFRPYDYADCLAMSKWSTRGWCLQEGLLAQRQFVFTEEEIFFECRQGVFHESQAQLDMFARDNKNVLHVVDNFGMSIFNGHVGVYSKTVSSYLHKDLTRESDILDAFSGLANAYNKCYRQPLDIQTQSCWGLPCNYFGATLTWWPITIGEHPPRRRSQRSANCNFPSWSWIGWRIKEIDYTRKMRFQYEPFAMFRWPDEIWSAATKTGLIEFDAEVVSFHSDLEEARDDSDLEYDMEPCWKNGKGSFLSISEWKGYPGPGRSAGQAGQSTTVTGEEGFEGPGQTYGRFALRIKKMGEILYRVGHEINIPEEEWERGGPLQIHAKLG